MDKKQSLHYKRILTQAETDQIFAKLKDTWHIEPRHYWYPLVVVDLKNVFAFQNDFLVNEVSTDTIRNILKQHGIKRIWELNESPPDYELDISLFNPIYGSETFWCSQEMDWIIYTSHEESTAFGGWILEELKKVWSDWKDKFWRFQYSDERLARFIEHPETFAPEEARPIREFLKLLLKDTE